MSEAATVQDLNTARLYQDEGLLQLVPEPGTAVGKQAVDSAGRYPKLTTEQTAYLLERGPYVGRLRAQQSLLKFVQNSHLIEGQSGPTLPDYVELNVCEALAKGVQELEDFDKTHLPRPVVAQKRSGVAAQTPKSATAPRTMRTTVLPAARPVGLPSTRESQDYPVTHTRILSIISRSEEQDLSWQVDALCNQTDPEAFFPEKGGSTREAKKVCVGCDVRAECLKYALDHDERFGIWGGMSERERRKLKYKSL